MRNKKCADFTPIVTIASEKLIGAYFQIKGYSIIIPNHLYTPGATEEVVLPLYFRKVSGLK